VNIEATQSELSSENWAVLAGALGDPNSLSRYLPHPTYTCRYLHWEGGGSPLIVFINKKEFSAYWYIFFLRAALRHNLDLIAHDLGDLGTITREFEMVRKDSFNVYPPTRFPTLGCGPAIEELRKVYPKYPIHDWSAQ
jgi:hypothetical protein